MVVLASIISYFYILESISNLKSQEEHRLSCYANFEIQRIKTIEELQKNIFGTLESFTNKIAIIDENNRLLYSTFEETPMFNHEKKTYYKDGKVYFNAITHFEDAGTVKIIFGKEVDFATINVKITIIIITIDSVKNFL